MIEDPAHHDPAHQDPAAHVAERYRRLAARPEAFITLRPEAEVAAELAAVDPGLPLAGLLVAVKGNIDVAVGEEVAAGQTLLALEAMKMEAPVTAPAAGRVVAVVAEVGAHVAAGTVLVVLETTADSAEEEQAA